ncbi:MAG: CHAT domain-containing protein [Flavobacterium sp.]|nr:MAG: CHAT domain-containing protein [Flavobacterium sp.]
MVSKLQTCPSIEEEQSFDLLIWEYKLHRNKLKNKKAEEALLKALALLTRSHMQSDLDFELLLLEHYALRGKRHEFETLNKKLEPVIERLKSDRSAFKGRYYLSRHYGMDANSYPVERINFLHQALEQFEVSDSISVYYLGNTLRALGNLNRTHGDYDKSASFYTRELELYSTHYPEDHFNISICNYNLGGVYYEKLEYQKALDHFLKAHRIWIKTYKPDSHRMRSLNEAIGDMYWELDHHEKALEYFNYAVPFQKQVNNDSSENTLALADSLLQSGNYASAMKYYEEAVKWREKTFGKDHLLTGACKNFVGRALHAAGDVHASLNAYQEAINILVADLNNTSWYANPDINMQIQSGQYLLDALTAKGELLKELYRETSNRNDLIAALDTQETAIQLLEKIKNSEMSTASKSFWTTKTINLVDSAIDTALLLESVTGDREYIATAFNFTERSKALLLLASLNDQEVNSFANIPQEIIQKEKELKAGITEYVGRIETEEKRCAEVRDKILKLYTGKLHSLQNKYDLLINEIARKYPEYYELKYDVKIASIKEIQKKLLNNKKLIISYFSGEVQTYVFRISSKSYEVRRIENTAELNTKMAGLFEMVSGRQAVMSDPTSFKQYTTLAYELYLDLLQPELTANENLNQLILIPDGNISYVPFESLLTNAADHESINYRQLPYLFKKYAVSYSPSASIALVNNRVKSRGSGYYGFAPDYKSESDNELRKKPANLRFNQPEVEYAGELFKGEIWKGENVTEELLKRNSTQAGILHLAMHGQVEDQHPMLSRLFFNSSENEDGMLHIYEVYNLSIPAELVILSACNTASGKLHRGEGIMSLERAFQYAGSKSLLATLWSVDDAASSRITQLFLQNLKNGMPKNIALQQAKITFLETANPEKLHPFYWSSFRLTGNTGSLSRGLQPYYYGIGIGFLVIITALFLFRRKKRK